MIRKTALYRGQVQGVGFRMTAQRIAGRYAVTGYVRNLSDGRVELVAEGDRQQVDDLLADVARAMSDFIQDTDVSESEATGEFKGFGIRF